MTIRTFWAAALVIAAWTWSGAAQAQWMRSSQELGFYVGAGLGRAEAKDFCSDATALGFTGCDEKDRTWKLSAGYRFHRHVAVEAGYVDMGKVTARLGGFQFNADVKAFELLAVPIYPFGNGFSIYGKLGLARWDVDASGTGGFTASERGTDFTYGLGAQYDFTPNFAVRAEWQRYTDVDMNTLGVALLYMFR